MHSNALPGSVLVKANVGLVSPLDVEGVAIASPSRVEIFVSGSRKLTLSSAEAHD